MRSGFSATLVLAQWVLLSPVDPDANCGLRIAAIFRALSILPMVAIVFAASKFFLMAIIAPASMTWENTASGGEQGDSAY
jgi:hypothetical protein